MILDANGMPVLQPLVDDASTGTLNTAFAAVGTAFGSMLTTREMYTYRWPNTAARNAETSMRPGDTGYQEDTKTKYMRVDTAWVVDNGVSFLGQNGGTAIPAGASVKFATFNNVFAVGGTSGVTVSFPAFGGAPFMVLGQNADNAARPGVVLILESGSITASTATFVAYNPNGTGAAAGAIRIAGLAIGFTV